MPPPRKLDMILIHPVTEVRMRLKAAAVSVQEFGKCVHSSSLEEARRKFESEEEFPICDIVFVSYHYPLDEITNFIESSKTIVKTQDATFILMMEQGAKSNAEMGQVLLSGPDGFLFEPYSVDQLVDITKTAARIRRERSSAREIAALKLILKDVAKNVDTYWLMRRLQYDGEMARARLRDSCSSLALLTPEAFEIYRRLLVDAFDLAVVPPLPTNLVTYTGMSDRARKKVEQVMNDVMHASLDPADKPAPQPGKVALPPPRNEPAIINDDTGRVLPPTFTK